MPYKKQFIPEWDLQLKSSQKKLAQTMRIRVFQCLPAFYSKLDEGDDRVFLEPLLFAYFSGVLPDSMRLEQLLAGSIVNPGNSEEIPVCSNAEGIIYLPSLGYLKTGQATEEFTLLWDHDLQCYELKKDGMPAVFDLELLCQARGTGVELISNSYVPSSSFFEAEMLRVGDGFENIAERVFATHEEMIGIWKPQLESAFELLSLICPYYVEEIKSVIRKIVFFEDPALPPFAPAGLNGCALLNCREANSELPFITGLATCTTQLQFHLFTLERKRYFRINPDEIYTSGDTKQSSSSSLVYRAMEELVVSTRLAEILEACYRSDLFNTTLRREIAGRLVHNRDSCQEILSRLDPENVLTDKGVEFYKEMIIQRAEIYASLEEVLGGIRIKNQPRLFSRRLFKKANPSRELSEFT